MKNFQILVETALEDLLHQCENRFDNLSDLDLQDGVLRIELNSGAVYLINRHLPLEQIWLSSPQSGAWHFAPCADANQGILDFLSTRGEKISIYDILNRELNPAEKFIPLSMQR